MNSLVYTALRALTASALAITALSTFAAGNRGEVFLSTHLMTLPKATIDTNVALASLGEPLAKLIGQAKCDVSLHGVIFASRGPRNEAITSSALVAIPVRSAGCAISASAPVVAYDHGTTATAASTMTDTTNLETNAIVAIYAAQGYVVVAPDYHGLGLSSLLYHPYLHAASEADATVDALRAARSVLADKGLTIGKLFVTGYSQGGHASMATTRALETIYAGEFPLVAAAPMSGPYALEQSVVFGASVAPTMGGAILGAYAVVGYNKVYRTLYSKTSDIFRAPYASKVERYFPGSESISSLTEKGLLPSTIDGLFTAAFVNSLRNDSNSPFRVALRNNSLLDGWTPKVPMTLCGGARDPVVPYFNTPMAQQAFRARGGLVNVIEADTTYKLPPFTSDADVRNYHVRVMPLCALATRSQQFDPLK